MACYLHTLATAIQLSVGLSASKVAVECVGRKKRLDRDFTDVEFFWEILTLAIYMLGEFTPIKF